MTMRRGLKQYVVTPHTCCVLIRIILTAAEIAGQLTTPVEAASSREGVI